MIKNISLPVIYHELKYSIIKLNYVLSLSKVLKLCKIKLGPHLGLL